jgi:uncharacterized RDD family membrane protein YckC
MSRALSERLSARRSAVRAPPRLDTVRRIDTPEGVSVRLHVAGPLPRLAAWLLDWIARFTFYSTIGAGLALVGEAGAGVMSIVVFLGEWFYPVVFELRNNGQTPGKVLLGIMVVHQDGTPLSPAGALLRNLLRFADFLPFAYLGGLLCMVGTESFQRLGDLAAGTVVVYKTRPEDAAAAAEGAPIPPPIPLLLDEQRAILDFADRAPALSEERGLELAALLSPTFGGPAPVTLARLLGVARWLRGGAS